ncbi:S8 family serine peptidase [Cnuibacter physcomitrellae]|uniref:S8 family serine peptidase n=1 Tax=Cnuibacter physcomitrellae TaxID=1619308 RepID=UPI0021759FB0|nr:S8 family serine peptidase [Cnuibacter physcomitrellae]MCS5497716.1 S8 family serine peptidase [Cnuibacter physcomitrellae]
MGHAYADARTSSGRTDDRRGATLRRKAIGLTGGLVVAASLFAFPAVAQADPADPTGIADGGVSSGLARLAASGATPGTPEASRAAGLPAEGPGSLAVDGSGRVIVELRFESFEAQRAAIPAIQGLVEVRSVGVSAPAVSVYATPDLFDDAAALPGVVSLEPGLLSKHASSTALPTQLGAALGFSGDPDLTGTSCRSTPVNTAAPLGVDTVQAQYGLDGTGLTVGVISDSYDLGGDKVATHAAQDVLAGALPGPGNPCGYTTPVGPILEDNATMFTDEGRAMAQVVHGIAPGARLMFATEGATQTEFADNIQTLVDNGADVIVDDVVQYTEPWFQQGVVAQKIADIRAEGVLYVAAAQNEGSIGYLGAGTDDIAPTGSWESAEYRPGDCFAGIGAMMDTALGTTGTEVDCMDFGPAGAPAKGLPVTLETAATFALMTQWAEPVDGRSTVIVPFLLDAAGAPLPLSTDSGTFDDRTPASYVAYTATTDPTVQTVLGDYTLVLARAKNVGEPGTPRVKVIFTVDTGGVQRLPYARGEWRDDVVIGPAVFAHPADPAVLTSGAAPAFNPERMENYSGTGPATYYFGPVDALTSRPAERLLEPRVLVKPDLIGLDYVRTTFFESYYSGSTVIPDGYYFPGTSAAAPGVAAVAALAMQYSPQSTAEQVREALVSTAVPMPEQPFDYGVSDANVWGSGRVFAPAAIAALPPAPAPAPVPAAAASTRLADTGLSAGGAPGGVAFIALLLLACGALVSFRSARRGAASRRPRS